MPAAMTQAAMAITCLVLILFNQDPLQSLFPPDSIKKKQ